MFHFRLPSLNLCLHIFYHNVNCSIVELLSVKLIISNSILILLFSNVMQVQIKIDWYIQHNSRENFSFCEVAADEVWKRKTVLPFLSSSSLLTFPRSEEMNLLPFLCLSKQVLSYIKLYDLVCPPDFLIMNLIKSFLCWQSGFLSYCLAIHWKFPLGTLKAGLHLISFHFSSNNPKSAFSITDTSTQLGESHIFTKMWKRNYIPLPLSLLLMHTHTHLQILFPLCNRY